ncbi:hypothetical protein GF407_14115 [candidate division KSB1 bacterium]|nr:hypothetical protein [candidate division KSB1 bacterium]
MIAPKKCNYLKMVSRYMDNDLNEGEKKALQTHLIHCYTCQKHFKAFLHLKQASRFNYPVSPYFAPRVFSALKQTTPPFWKQMAILPEFLVKSGLVIATLILIFIATADIFNNSPSEMTEPSENLILIDELDRQTTLVSNDQALRFALNSNDIIKDNPNEF